MKTVRVKALKSFDYQGRRVYAGDVVEMDALQAAMRSRRGEVSLTKIASSQQAYLRRDMVPETIAQSVPVQRRRRTRHADMGSDE